MYPCPELVYILNFLRLNKTVDMVTEEKPNGVKFGHLKKITLTCYLFLFVLMIMHLLMISYNALSCSAKTNIIIFLRAS